VAVSVPEDAAADAESSSAIVHLEAAAPLSAPSEEQRNRVLSNSAEENAALAAAAATSVRPHCFFVMTVMEMPRAHPTPVFRCICAPSAAVCYARCTCSRLPKANQDETASNLKMRSTFGLPKGQVGRAFPKPIVFL
jgi:hypothetical protein